MNEKKLPAEAELLVNELLELTNEFNDLLFEIARTEDKGLKYAVGLVKQLNKTIRYLKDKRSDEEVAE
ncbi:hypothetical protein NHG29_09245 [Aerococcaceae bacterium NML160702]|nr:hypothetical protein [Aerococcaceae bacterium NML160702]